MQSLDMTARRQVWQDDPFPGAKNKIHIRLEPAVDIQANHVILISGYVNLSLHSALICCLNDASSLHITLNHALFFQAHRHSNALRSRCHKWLPSRS